MGKGMVRTRGQGEDQMTDQMTDGSRKDKAGHASAKADQAFEEARRLWSKGAVEDIPKKLRDAAHGLWAQMERLIRVQEAASALLKQVDSMTTEEFSRGEERREREQLRGLLKGARLRDGTRPSTPRR